MKFLFINQLSVLLAFVRHMDRFCLSLLPDKCLTGEATHLVADCAAEVLAHQLIVVFIISWVKLSCIVVLELWMFFYEAVGKFDAS